MGCKRKKSPLPWLYQLNHLKLRWERGKIDTFYCHNLKSKLWKWNSIYLLWGGHRGLWNDRWWIQLLLSRFRALSSGSDIPRTLLLFVLGGIGRFNAYYNRYFEILLIAPFVFNEGYSNPLCIKLMLLCA